MGNFFTNVQGRPDDMGKRVLRRRIVFNIAKFSGGIPIGAVEKGGVIVSALAIINTPFNAGTTNTLTLGDSAVVDSLVTAANSAPGTAGGKVGTGVKLFSEAPADTIFYAYFSFTGTAPTAGDATFLVDYVPAYPWSDLNGGQAS